MSISNDQNNIKQAQQLRQSGRTNSEIANIMGVSPRTVGRLLANGAGTTQTTSTPVTKAATTTVTNQNAARDAEIHKYKSQKLSNAEIARLVGVSPRTVGRVLENAAPVAPTTTGPTIKRFNPTPVQTETKATVTPVAPESKPVQKEVEYVYDYLITGSSATVIRMVEGESESATFQINKNNPKFNEVIALILAGNYADAINEIDKKELLRKFTVGLLNIENNQVKYAGRVLANKLTNRILDDINSGGTFHKHLGSFLDRAMNNISEKSVSELWDFIEHNDIQLTEDGKLIGWKKVTKNKAGDGYVDSHTKQIPNNLGSVVYMPRSLVDDNRQQTCSQGLHVGAWSYVPSFSGDTILRVIIDPADVVSVPSDYNGAKMRTSRYYIDAIVDDKKTVVKLGTPNGVVIKAGPQGFWVTE